MELDPSIVQLQSDIRSGKEVLSYEWFTTKSFPTIWTCQVMCPSLTYPIGMVWVSSPLLRGKMIDNIWVEENYQRLGIATFLLAQIWKWQDDKDLKIVGTQIGNEKSIPWLKNCGFKEDKIIGWKSTRKSWLTSESYKRYEKRI